MFTQTRYTGSGDVEKFAQTRYTGVWRRFEVCAKPVYRRPASKGLKHYFSFIIFRTTDHAHWREWLSRTWSSTPPTECTRLETASACASSGRTQARSGPHWIPPSGEAPLGRSWSLSLATGRARQTPYGPAYRNINVERKLLSPWNSKQNTSNPQKHLFLVQILFLSPLLTMLLWTTFPINTDKSCQ